MLIVVAGFAWITNRESETVRRAAGLHVGMPKSEVDAIMGEPFMKTRRANGELVTFYGTAFERINFGSRNGMYSLFLRLGLTSIDVRMTPPVVIEFDDEQRVAIWFTNGRRDPQTIPAGSSN
ncbi:hypothetical protein AYO47_00020 [Planctomyces sp. SCGC AG-212-M04]|nr:hypothetical protein AYO47_00020 [Planctomyces sp. SCGC AG-212-M04]